MRPTSSAGYPPARWRGGSSEAAKPLSAGWGGYACSEFAIGALAISSERAAPPTPDPSPPRAEFTLGLAEGKTRGRAGGGEQKVRS
jgi:hypothetical protein